MKRLLIVYATVEGQTRKIAEFLAKEAAALGFMPVLHDAAASIAEARPAAFEKVIVTAPVHLDKHHPAVEQFIATHQHALKDQDSALLSVSVSAAGDAEDRHVAWEYTRTLLGGSAWRPARVEIVPGALKFSSSDFFKRWIMKRLARKKRAPIENDGDVEYTDWPELARFLKQFLTEAPRP